MRDGHTVWHSSSVPFLRQRVPDSADAGQTLFVTWTLEGCLPRRCFLPPDVIATGDAFSTVDKLLDEARTGPVHLRHREIADMAANVLKAQAGSLRHFDLHAYVVMANHVHALLTPLANLDELTSHFQQTTARCAFELLGLTGGPFWNADVFAHQVSGSREMEQIQAYIEQNPVRAALVSRAAEFAYSSAGERKPKPLVRAASAATPDGGQGIFLAPPPQLTLRRPMVGMRVAHMTPRRHFERRHAG